MDAPPNASPEVVQFFGDLKKADIGGEFARLRMIVRGEQGWQGAAWWLERVKGYAKPQPQPVVDPKPIRIEIVDPADADEPDQA
jgi:hypothetical protein